ncbi:MAG: hypothetical protein JW891_13175 [Candidatus Lokiarchaeota archaeon]|nr:hypothetical protein [Candidatus Lokiarchaeota archaeon]
MEVKLPDTPGSLIELIRPISENGGNVFGILHHHDKIVNNLIPVDISFELSEDLFEVSMKNIKKELSEKKIQIESITLGHEQNTIVVILNGHVFESDIADTIKRLASKNIRVSEIQAKITEVSAVSNVKFKLEFPESVTKDDLISELETICQEKNLFLLRS